MVKEQGFELTQKSLLKMTQDEMEDILKASKHGLKDVYLQNDYVYLVNDDGSDGVFKGFKGNANEGVTAPYLVCTKHTQQTWEEYLASQPVAPEEPLPGDVVEQAVYDISIADTLIIAGTSLTVYPAASYIRYFRGKHLVLINRDATPYDSHADLVIHDKVGEVLAKADELIHNA